MEIISTPVLSPPLYAQNIWALLDPGALVRLGAAPLLTGSPHYCSNSPTVRCQPVPGKVPAPTHHIRVCLFKESLSEDGHNEDVNDEGDKESDAGLDEEILISFSYFPLVCTVHLPGLKRRW